MSKSRPSGRLFFVCPADCRNECPLSPLVATSCVPHARHIPCGAIHHPTEISMAKKKEPKQLDELFHDTLKDIQQARQGDRGSGQAARAGLQDHRREAAGQEVPCDHRPDRRKRRGRQGVQGLARARRRPAGGGASRRALRDLALRHAECLGGRTRPAGRGASARTDARRGEKHRQGAHQSGRVRGQPAGRSGLIPQRAAK